MRQKTVFLHLIHSRSDQPIKTAIDRPPCVRTDTEVDDEQGRLIGFYNMSLVWMDAIMINYELNNVSPECIG